MVYDLRDVVSVSSRASVRSTPSRRQHEVLAQSANPCDEDATHPFCVLTEAIELEYDGPLSGQDRIAGQGAAASSSPSGGSDGTRRRPPQQRHRLPPVVLRMPNTAFGIAMGLGGHAVMWKGAGSTFIQDYIDAKGLNYFFWLTGVVVGMCITTSYIFKALTGFQYIVDEFRYAALLHERETQPYVLGTSVEISRCYTCLLLVTLLCRQQKPRQDPLYECSPFGYDNAHPIRTL
mmetsp:Transcript_1689/g.2272  ORF Transcript_1689/g.2272 Transcript_1689/m.2272 type:complete len:234 (+) Transcript_1689:290-991(+)